MQKIFPLLYSLYIMSFYLIGGFTIGMEGLTMTKVLTVVMIFLCWYLERNIYIDRFFVIYLVFWSIRLLASLYDGLFDEFIERFIRAMPMAYALYISSIVLTKRNYSFGYLTLPIVCIGILNAIVTICQSFGLPYFDVWLANFDLANEYETGYISRHGEMYGLSVSGIFQTPVKNGHFTLFILFMSLTMWKKTIGYLGLFASSLIFVGLFFCQQRSAFFIACIGVALTLYIILQKRHKKWGILLFALVLLLMPLGFEYLQNLGTRITNINFSTREGLYSYAVDFIGNHPFLGGYELYCHQMQRPPHNLILSAFVGGGLLGGLLLLFLIAMQTRLIIKYVKGYGNDITLLSFAYISLILDSLTHNSGLVEGDPTTWLVWGAFLGFITKIKYNESFVCNRKFELRRRSKNVGVFG